MFDEILNNESVSEQLVTGNYAQAMETFSERMISFRNQENFDKAKFNELIATEQHASSAEEAQHDWSGSTP